MLINRIKKIIHLILTLPGRPWNQENSRSYRLIRYVVIMLFLLPLTNQKNPIIAQNFDINDISALASLIEEITEQTNDEELSLQFLDDLAELIKNPVDINNSSTDELRKLVILNEFQINSIIQYRQEFGNFMSINELQLVPGFRSDIVQKISPFIMVEDIKSKEIKGPIKNYIKYDGIVRYKHKFEIPAGFGEGIDSLRRFTGSPHYLLIRQELSVSKKIKAGLLTEKDAGEAFFSPYNNNKPDHISGYLELTGGNKIKKLIIGDYKTGFGQGLISGCSFVSKTSSAIILPAGDRIKKSLSASESGNLRGLAMQVRAGKTDSYVFVSSVEADARINSLSSIEDSISYFSSIYTSGLHRNDNENVHRNTLSQFNAGVNTIYHHKNLKLGVVAKYTAFNHHKEISVYNDKFVQPEYRNDFLNFGVHYCANMGNTILFGEFATDYDNHPAFLNGLIARLHPLITISVLQRYYSIEYLAFSASPFSKSSSPGNEKGIYIGLNFYPVPFLNLACYADHYSFPWLRQNIPSPYSGSEYFLNATLTLPGEHILNLRYKTDSRYAKNEREETGINLTVPCNNRSLKINLQSAVGENLNLETRCDLSFYGEPEQAVTKGFYLGQKLIIKSVNKKNVLWLSYGLFDIPDWRNRIYIYENDVLYDFSMPALYRQGSRLSFMVKTAGIFIVDIWLKYYQNLYLNVVDRGTGADLIRAKTDSGLKVQIRVKI